MHIYTHCRSALYSHFSMAATRFTWWHRHCNTNPPPPPVWTLVNIISKTAVDLDFRRHFGRYRLVIITSCSWWRKNPRHGVLQNPHWVRHHVLEVVHNYGQRSERGCGNCHKGEDGGMGHWLHMLPWTKCGKLLNCLCLAADPPRRSLPPRLPCITSQT